MRSHVEEKSYLWNRKGLEKENWDLFYKKTLYTTEESTLNRIYVSEYNYDSMLKLLDGEIPTNRALNIDGSIRRIYTSINELEQQKSIFANPHIVGMFKHFSKFKEVNVGSFNTVDLNNNELLNISMQFYSFLDEILEINASRRISTLESKSPDTFHILESKVANGGYFPDTYHKLVHLLIYRDQTIQDLFAVTHERGHVLDYNNNVDFSIEKKLVAEIVPYIVEQFLLLYLKRKGYDINQIHNYEVFSYNNAITHAQIAALKYSVYEQLESVKQSRYPKREITEKDHKYVCYYRSPHDLVRYSLDDNFDFIENIKYIFCYLVVQELMSLYNTNPKQAVINIKKLIERGNNINPLELLKTMDITPENIDNKLKSNPKIFVKA